MSTPVASIQAKYSAPIGGLLVFVVSLDQQITDNTIVTVHYSTTDGTAVSGVDYRGVSDFHLPFNKNLPRVQEISIEVYFSDATLKTFTLTLDSVSGGSVGTPSTATGKIIQTILTRDFGGDLHNILAGSTVARAPANAELVTGNHERSRRELYREGGQPADFKNAAFPRLAPKPVTRFTQGPLPLPWPVPPVTLITVTAATSTKAFDGTTTSSATPTITGGSLAGGDTAAFTESYNSAAIGTGKALTPAGTVNDGAGGAHYSVTFVAVTSGEVDFPATPLGVWWMDAYVATPRPYVPNAISSGAPSPNLMPAPSGLFGLDHFGAGYQYDPFDYDVVDRNATGPDGTANAASTLTINSAVWCFLRPAVGNVTLPAGTYTLAANFKITAGVNNQEFTMGEANVIGRNSHTMTTSWTRHKETFTIASPTACGLFWHYADNTLSNFALNNAFAIANCELFAGNADLGAPTGFPVDSHLYLGRYAADTVPTYATGALNMQSNGRGLVQLPTAQSLTAFTLSAVISKPNAIGSGFVEDFISKVQYVATVDLFTRILGGAFATRSLIADTTLSFPGVQIFTHTDSYRMLSVMYDGTDLSIWIDDCRLAVVNSAGLGPVVLQDIWLAWAAFNKTSADFLIASMCIYGRALSSSEMSAVYNVSKTRVALNNTILATRVVIWAGDSRMAGFAGTPVSTLVVPNLSPMAYGYNEAVAGSNLANAITRAAVHNAGLPAVKSGKYIYVAEIGHNDDLSNPAAFAATYAAFLDAQRALGWLVVVGTLPASATLNDANRLAFNAIVRTWVGTHADALADGGGDAVMGDVANVGGVNWSQADPAGVHETTAGYTLLEPYYRAAVNSL